MTSMTLEVSVPDLSFFKQCTAVAQVHSFASSLKDQQGSLKLSCCSRLTAQTPQQKPAETQMHAECTTRSELALTAPRESACVELCYDP